MTRPAELAINFVPPSSRSWGALRAILNFGRRKPLGAFGAVVIVVMVSVALLAPLLAPYAYDHQVLSERLRGPSLDHLMGTDNLGRDIFSRVVYGARISIRVGFGAVIISTTLSGTIGIVSGYYGGKLDLAFQRVVDIWMALPGLVAIIFFISVFGHSLNNLTLLLGFLGVGGASRVSRSAAIAVRHNPYIEAARVVGASDFRIMRLYVLPNVLHVIVVGSTVSIGSFILAEASLAFLGLGVPPPYPTWGSMLNVSREFLDFPWMVLFPGLALSCTVFAFNVLGDALRDVLDPRMRGT
jgi:peptide/nickel transport system permease protein